MIKVNASGCCSGGANDTCCCGNASSSKKTLLIEYLYLDLAVCDRCIGTDAVLEDVVETLRPVLTLAGYEVAYRKIEMKTPELAAQYHFVSSPTILVNGMDIFGEVKEAACGCCGELAGTNIDCRVFECDGQSYEVPTKAMMADAIMKSLSGITVRREVYVLPENLKRFYKGKAKKEQGCCCSENCCQ